MPLKPNIYKSKILVLHGADDPIVPDDQTIAFWNEMREAKANWKFVAYGGAPHLYKLADAGTVRHPPFITNRLAAAVLPCRISYRRWCSDGFEIGCDNGEPVRVAFALA